MMNRDDGGGYSVFKNWRHRLKNDTAMKTPLSCMQSFMGLATSYWLRSNERTSAWLLTAGVVALTIASSKASIYTAKGWSATQDSLYRLGNESNPSTMEELGSNALALAGIVLGRMVVIAGGRHLMSSNLHRRARRWLVSQYNEALFDAKQTHLHITSDKTHDKNSPLTLPDNIDQRIDESSGAFYGSIIGLPMGFIGAGFSMYFVIEEMMKTSTPMESLPFLGAYATSALAVAVAASYVGPNTYIAYKFGQLQKWISLEQQKAGGSWRSEMGNTFRRSSQIAASKGEEVQSTILKRLYDRVDTVWWKDTLLDSAFLGYKNSYNYFANRGASYIPFLSAYANGDIDLKGYLEGTELTSELIGDLSWFVNVMPALAHISANSDRLTEISRATEAIHNTKEFYKQRGVSEFNRASSPDVSALQVNNLELMFAGHNNPETFLRAENLEFKAGEWSTIVARNGAGKSLFLKALTGQWMYGRGDITYAENKKIMYASQEPDLPDLLSLKELVTYPKKAEDFSDVEIAALLNKVDLGQFIEKMQSDLCEGKSWKDVFSGGQKQKLVQARILLHKPNTLLLDEATSAMDPSSARKFFQSIKDGLPDTSVVAITHYDFMPQFKDGSPMFDKVIYVDDKCAKTYLGSQYEDILQRERALRELEEKGDNNPQLYWLIRNQQHHIPDIS